MSISALAINIVSFATSYIGQKEISGNKGFKDPAFQKKMERAGWKPKEAWCVYFAETVWKDSFDKHDPRLAILDRLFSGSATATWNNFKANTKFKTGSVPKAGAIAIWRYGNGWQGHAAIVVAARSKRDKALNAFDTIEGNTNAVGGREGEVVAEKARLTGLPFSKKGLNLLGFIYPD